MKLSWGYKILIVYLLFVAGIVFLVISASRQKFDLVTNDYYSEELKYQQIIDQAANAAKLSAPVSVIKSAGALKIIFPAEMNSKKKKVNFYLYCPADAKKDFRKTMEVHDSTFTQVLPAGIAGLYELKLSWETEGITYYHDQKIFF